MGLAQDHRFAHAHAHVNLLGWVSLALYGVVYQSAPQLAEGRLPRLHFWLATAGALLMSTGLVGFGAGTRSLLPLVVVGSLMTVGAMSVFAVVVASVRRRVARDATQGLPWRVQP
jgi:cbb3-type cytochrome oxidase subunit 1